jgi:hypothetical protein
MSYLTQSTIAHNGSMTNRMSQAAAEQGAPGDADQWVYVNRRKWAAAPGWDAAWESAVVSHPDVDYDPGADEGVITDSMILSQIQSMLASPPP